MFLRRVFSTQKLPFALPIWFIIGLLATAVTFLTLFLLTVERIDNGVWLNPVPHIWNWLIHFVSSSPDVIRSAWQPQFCQPSYFQPEPDAGQRGFLWLLRFICIVLAYVCLFGGFLASVIRGLYFIAKGDKDAADCEGAWIIAGLLTAGQLAIVADMLHQALTTCS